MKRRFAKFALITISVITLTLAFIPESQAHLFANLFGHGYGHRSAYCGSGYRSYRPTYYSPRASYYHSPGYNTGFSRPSYRYSSYGSSSCGNNNSQSYASYGNYSLSGCCNGGCAVSGGCNNGGCNNGECGLGGCATGNCGVSTGEQSSIQYDNSSPTPVENSFPIENQNPAINYNNDTDTYKSNDNVQKKFERREEPKDNMDDTGSDKFVPRREKAPVPEKEDGDNPFGGTKGFGNGTSTQEKSGDGLEGRNTEDELQLQGDPILPENNDDDDLFGGSDNKRESFKIPAKNETDAIKELDDIMDKHNIETNASEATKQKSEVIKQGKQGKGAPTKAPVEDESSSIRKPAQMPRLEVEPIGADDHIAWQTIPTYRRISIRSRFSAPQIARTRVAPGRSFLSPIHLDSETKLVSK